MILKRNFLFARRATPLIDILMVQYREEPGSQIGAAAPQMKLCKRSAESFLNKIVGIDHITGQCPRVLSQTRDQCLDLVVKPRFNCVFLQNTGPPLGKASRKVPFLQPCSK